MRTRKLYKTFQAKDWKDKATLYVELPNGGQVSIHRNMSDTTAPPTITTFNLDEVNFSVNKKTKIIKDVY